MNSNCFLLIFGFLLFSCNSVNIIDYDKDVESFIKDIPDENLKLIKDETEKLLNIETIENGYNEFQIRVWLGYSFNDTAHLLILSKQFGKWEGKLYEMIYHYQPKTYDSILQSYYPVFPDIIEIEKNISVVDPVSGWELFLKNLFNTGVFDLPHYKRIPDYYLPTDADGVTFEIASQKKYRLFHYPSPELYSGRIREADKVIKIIKLIEKEFGFRRLNQ